MNEMQQMMARHARDGRVAWIGLRPARREAMVSVLRVVVTDAGMAGDRSRGGKRAVTLIQAEHLPAITALAGREATPELLRRNLVIAGTNLVALKGRQVRIGSTVLEITGPCHPCSRMEEALGPGGYSAMRGHGGVCATVVAAGEIALGDALRPL